MSGFNKVYAETTENESPVGIVEKFLHNGDIVNNPYADKSLQEEFFKNGDILNNPFVEKGINFNLGSFTSEQVQKAFDMILSKTIDFGFKGDFLIDVVDLAIRCLSYVYTFITKIIIATPAVIFNSTWFAESYLKFAGISIVVFTLMALWNSGRKTFNFKATPISDVIKRYFLAITGIGFATFFFQQFFKFIKFISEIIVSIGYSEIFAKDFTNFMSLTTGDTVALILFVLVLIGLTVKIVLENGRRWFGLASIGLLSSFSLSAWVFDSTRVVFSDVKEKFIKLSLTQIYHASLISLMGVFLLGTAGVETFTDLAIKLGLICGGFTALANPPKFLDKLIDKNTSTVLNMVDDLTNVLSYKLNPAYAHGTSLLKKSFGFHDKITAPTKLEKRLKAGKRFVK